MFPDFITLFIHNQTTCEAIPVSENSSFIFTVYVKSVPLFHFNLLYVVLHMAAKKFSKPNSKNGEIGHFNLESCLTNLELQLHCTAEFISKALKDLFFVC